MNKAKFEVGGIYDNGCRFVCVWRSRGKKPRAHFVEEWEHEMNLIHDTTEYSIDRDVNGSDTNNGVHPIHEKNYIEVAMWNGESYDLSASMFVGTAKMRMSKKDRKQAKNKIEREQSDRECREFYAGIAKAVVRFVGFVYSKYRTFFKWMFSRSKYSARARPRTSSESK